MRRRYPFSLGSGLPTGLAAHAMGVPETRLRNWLVRGQFGWGAPPEPGKHARFNLEDIIVGGFAAKLVDYGCPVEVAFQHLSEFRASLASIIRSGFEEGIGDFLGRSYIVATQLDGEWSIKFGYYEEQIEDKADQIIYMLLNYSSTLFLNPAIVFEEIFGRLFPGFSDEANRVRYGVSEISSGDSE